MYDDVVLGERGNFKKRARLLPRWHAPWWDGETRSTGLIGKREGISSLGRVLWSIQEQAGTSTGTLPHGWHVFADEFSFDWALISSTMFMDFTSKQFISNHKSLFSLLAKRHLWSILPITCVPKSLHMWTTRQHLFSFSPSLLPSTLNIPSDRTHLISSEGKKENS
jgi:hypothetical protein